MAQYSDEEKQAFKDKDLRISRLSTLKDCIDKLADFDELVARKQEVTEISEYLVEYVYKGLQNGVADSGVADGKETIDWEEVAGYGGYALPDKTNIKILNLIVDELKSVDVALPTPTELLTHIINRFGRYPTNKSGVTKVVKSIIER